MRRASRILTSNGSNVSGMPGRIFRRESTVTNGSSPRSSSAKWQPAKKPLCAQQSNTAKFSRSANVSSRNVRRQTQKFNIFDALNRFREKIVEFLVNIQFTILDFILEPADRLFANEVEASYPAQRFGGCTGNCCRNRIPANRSQSATVLSIKNRHHLTVHQKRTISENFNFR